jgi:membrane protein DedA with SNARE-associated domain
VDFLALAGIALLLLVKEAGLPIPVPGDLVVLGAGAAAAATGPIGVVTALGVILLAGYAGASVQFALVRRALRELVLGLLVRTGISRDRLEALAGRLRRSGARGVAVAKATPGIRIGAVAASGLSGLPYPPFLAGLVVGNGAFVGLHFALGLFLGPAAMSLAGSASSAAVVLVGALVVLALFGAVGWRVLARRRALAARADVPGPRVAIMPALSWADAACPACLALAFAIPGQVSADGPAPPTGTGA